MRRREPEPEPLDARLTAINDVLADTLDLLGVRAAIVRVDELDLLEENARYMRHETFARLVENIKHDGALTSVPYCWRVPETGRYLVLSGNHRVKGAREAGREVILILFNDQALSEQERIAIQLSHNALVGEDDPGMLKALYDRLDTFEAKVYSGLDDKTLDLLERVQPIPMSEVNLAFTQLAIIFLPEELEEARRAFEDARRLHKADETWLARWRDYDAWLDSLDMAGSAHGVKNMAVSLSIVLAVFRAHQTDLADGWLDAETDETRHKNWVPLASITGTDRIPPESAKIIRQAVELMQGRGDVQVKNRWQALEYMAAEFLAGARDKRGEDDLPVM
jgi:hypothetical protein